MGKSRPLPGQAEEHASAAVEVEDLTIVTGGARLVDGVSFRVAQGRTLALVGESGAGKSLSARAIMGLLPPGIRVAGGCIRLGGAELTGLRPSEWRNIRGRDVSMVFQNPLRSLNPSMRVGVQIMEAVSLHHERLTKTEARQRAKELLDSVRIADAERRFNEYPHQMSGGMLQRVVIAIALASNPRLLIADEPTTALDGTTQVQILTLLRNLQERNGMAMILVTHDIRIAEEYAHDVGVMYSGKIVESGPIGGVLRNPRMPYTEALMKAVPSFSARPRSELYTIPGTQPHPARRPTGCSFAPRCAVAIDRCGVESPPPSAMPGSGSAHVWNCWVTAESVS